MHTWLKSATSQVNEAVEAMRLAAVDSFVTVSDIRNVVGDYGWT